MYHTLTKMSAQAYEEKSIPIDDYHIHWSYITPSVGNLEVQVDHKTRRKMEEGAMVVGIAKELWS